LAELGGISIQKLEKYNDMTSGAKVATDHPYYFKRKKNKASIHFHVVQPNESMWGIAQKYGLKLKKLRMKNRMGEQEKAEAGRVLWLRFIRPADIPVEYQKTQAPAPAAKPVPVDKKQLIQSSGQPSVQKPAQEEEPFFEFEESAGQSAPQPSHEDDIKSFRELTPAIQKETKALNEGAGNAINSGKPTHHSVATSETLYGIAQQYSVSVQDLERWNPGIQHAPLKVGQAVKIFSPEHENGAALEPMHDISSGQYAVHVVQPGETLYGIARMHDVSIKEIMEWNGKADFTIKTGESLRIKNK
jgi:membrane-bound lytic murein transglycosylase D